MRAFFLGVQIKTRQEHTLRTILERLWALVESTETSGELVISLGVERMRIVSFSSKYMAVGIRPRIMHY